MKLVADECVPAPIVRRLRADGHDIVYVLEGNRGAEDDDVLGWAAAMGAPLITADHDFGELVFRLARTSSGVVLLRLEGLSNALRAEIVSKALRDLGDTLPGAFVVITPGLVRVRRE